MKKLKLFSLGLMLSLVFFVFSVVVSRQSQVNAATLYWVGNDGANASVASNWKTTNPASCGSGDASAIPGSSDTINFDADCDNGAVIDSSFSSTVSVLTISSGYAGTITLSNPLTISGTLTTSGGTWNSTNQTLSVSVFTMNTGAIFTASSGTTTFSSTFTINGGTFNHNSGTVKFSASTATLTCNSITFNSVDLSAISPTNAIKTISSGCALPLGAGPTIGGGINLTGTLTGSGTITSSATNTNTFNSGAALTGFTGWSQASSTFTVAGATLDFGSYTTAIFNALTVSSGSLTLPSGADLNGALTISAGTFNAPSGTMTLAGALTISGTPTFNANGGTITFDGGTVTLACNNVTFNRVNLSGSSGGVKTVSSDCSLPLGANPTITNRLTLTGTLSGSGKITMTPGGSSNINTGAQFIGFTGFDIENVSSGSFIIGGATLDFSTYTTFINTSSITVNSGSLSLPSGAVLQGFTINGGTVNLPNGTITVSGIWTYSGGEFHNGNGTVVLNGSNQSVRGSTTFYNLSKVVTSSDTLTFTSDATQTVLGTLTLSGASGSKLSLRSTTTGLQRYINATGGRVLNNLDVQDSNGIGNAYVCSSCTDSGNNTNWTFINGSSIQFSLNYPNGNSHITNTNPTYRWSKATVSNNSAITKYELFIQPKTDTDQDTGTGLYVDNIAPFVGDNRKYQYNLIYTLYDDGEYLNLTPNNYLLNLGKYNFRIVSHDSAGNIVENSVEFWLDPSFIVSTSNLVVRVNTLNVPYGKIILDQTINEEKTIINELHEETSANPKPSSDFTNKLDEKSNDRDMLPFVLVVGGSGVVGVIFLAKLFRR